VGSGKLTLTLSERATLTVVVYRRLPGRRAGLRCQVHARLGSRCTVRRRKLTRRFAGIVGRNAFGLRISGLARGAYSLTVVAQDDTGAMSKTHTVHFRIRRRKA
jgi:hypothetical protein